MLATYRVLACAGICTLTAQLNADGGQLIGNTAPIKADSHAPIGVMGDHLHQRDEWMVSYRYMAMHMEDNLQGSSSIGNEQVVTGIANPYAPPATLRVVPREMDTEMQMLGAMYAPSDKLTLMATLNYVRKQMDHTSYMGMMGTVPLGTFSTESSGLGDTKLGALYGLADSDHHKLHLNFALSLPTGSIEERDDVLSPMNTRPRMRLPYAMQLGSGTYDLEPGITYKGQADRIGWGAQYLATLRLGKNDEDYAFGDVNRLTGWASYRLADGFSASLRLSYRREDRIDGADSRVMAPVTTANPDNYGGESLDLALGFNLVAQQGRLRGQRLALEYQTKIYQDANGVGLEMQDMLTLGWQLSFHR